DVFVAKLNPYPGNGNVSLGFSTYVGGANYETAYGIAVDAAGGIYITGQTQSANYPILDPSPVGLAGPYGDAFVTKFNQLNNSPLTLAYSALLGGSGVLAALVNVPTSGTSIAIDPTGAVQVAGYTSSPNFPLRNAFQATYIDVTSDGFLDSDGFLTRLPA